MKISDIYAGKPDATDEIRERGYEEFANNYIQPTGIDVDKLASTEYGTPFFVMGDKGTGKTALLHYLENYVRTIDSSACSSFISFENDFSSVEKKQFNDISHSISTSIAIENTVASIGQNDVECDFSYIWRWQIYQKVINDHELFNGGLFVANDKWDDFTREINKISKTVSDGKMRIPAKVSFSIDTNPQIGSISPTVSVEPMDLSKRSFDHEKSYGEFVRIIEKADSLIQSVTRTDIPYYIFIDELEAYRGESGTFYRDLRMIRDLLFTVKRINSVFGSGTKIICSVRLEILNAINRFVQSNQLHKIMQGYDERLTWEHTNTNSFSHPIIGVLLRRIQIAEEKNAGHSVSTDYIIKNWFVSSVYNMHICTYILDNTWHKPRDIVRLLLSAQSKNSKNSSCFNQNTFETFMPAYSRQCLDEVREEMRALYTADDIECVFNCMQGFKVVFSYEEIVKRAKTLYPNSTFAKDTYTVLNDMYRIGVIGNTLSDNSSSRWVYKEQYKFFIDSPWLIVIHPSLRIELSVSKRIDKRIEKQRFHQRNNSALIGEVYSAKLTEISYRYIRVEFVKDDVVQKGYISLRNLGIEVEEGTLHSLFRVGDELLVQPINYSSEYSNWYMRIAPNKD